MNIIFKLFVLLLCTNLFSIDTIISKDMYLSCTAYPHRVFTNQKFDIKLKAVILKPTKDYDKIAITFVDEENINILTQSPEWIKEKDNIFTTKITFKISNTNFKLPLVTIALIKDDEIVEYLSLTLPKIIFDKIAIDQKLFSNVIAKDLQVNSIKIKQYTNNQLLATLNIESINGNIEDFNLDSYQEQGIKDRKGSYPNQEIYYFVVIPSHTKQIHFTYYNTDIKNFKTINLQVTLEEDLISTQTNLNPYNSSILIYKQVFVIVLLLISLGLYLFTKKNQYLVLVTFFIIIITFLFIPNKKIIINQGEKIYILPTKKSTIFYTLTKKELVEIINEKENYTKVLFQNQTIGWIKK